MRFVLVLGPCILFDIVSLVAVNPRLDTSNGGATATPLLNSTWVAIPNNDSNLLSPTAKARCDDRYGHDLEILSCELALANVPLERELTYFGDRHIGQFGIGLPYRFLSRE